MDELTDHLLADGPALEEPDQREAFRIDGDRLANWALGKLAAAQAEDDRLRQLAEAERARVTEWEDDARRAVRHDIDFFTGKLIDYRRQLEADDPKLPRTYKLPGGSITVRAGRDRLTVTDEAALVEWALEHPEMGALSMKPLTSKLADLPRVVFEDEGPGCVIDTTTGAAIPGVVVTPGQPTYGVRPAAPGGPF